MRHLFISLLLLCSILPLWAGCDKGNDPNSSNTSISIPPQKGITLQGVVMDETNQPVEGVVVNDGTQFTQTDKKGMYFLKTDLSKSRFVSISVPAAFEIGTDKQIANGFYAPLSANEKVNRRDFILKRREQATDEFLYIALSDPQVKNENQLERFRTETMPDLNETLSRYSNKETYGMVLGDMVFDVMSLFAPYKDALRQTPVKAFFHTIGNHDIDLSYNDFLNTEDPSKGYGEKIYESHFGPTDYSVNIGKIHIITLKNLDYFQGKKYTERLTEPQLEWLRKDLSYVEPGTTVFLNLHAPSSNKTGDNVNMNNTTLQLIEILKDYKVHLFAGHTHFYENAEVNPSFYEHNIGAACGAWWAGDVNRCGAPNGYLVTEVNGDKISWFYKATGKEMTYQFRAYKPGEFETQSSYVVANIWDWDSAYSVNWYEDGILKGTMEQFADEDQDYIRMHGKTSGYKTNHLFRALPGANAQRVTIEVTNRFGEIFKNEIFLQQRP